jgi:hypothetical protein
MMNHPTTLHKAPKHQITSTISKFVKNKSSSRMFPFNNNIFFSYIKFYVQYQMWSTKQVMHSIILEGLAWAII